MFSFRRKMSCEVGRSMGSGQENQEVGVKERLNKQLLAHAVKSIQWSYAIFWSISSTQPGVLEWGEGYYNGDIKTRKTVQAIELNDEQLGFQRTEQLRELYESLSADETNPEPERPSASLSPEDLTGTEWYFLVCMSFFFKIGQGLPGRTLASNQTIWLSNAHCADSKLFSRSLLAKSASIKTVVCFPYLEGVVELGATDLILEDQSIIRHLKSSFFEIPSPIVPKIPGFFIDIEGKDKSFPFIEVDHNILDTNLNRVVECEEVNIICSTNSSSNSFQPSQQDEMNNCVQIPMNSSDYTSQSFSTPKEIVPLSNGEYNDTKQTSFDLQEDDIHYQSVLSTLLKTSENSISQNSNKHSSFVNWKKGGSSGGEISQAKTPQRVLKKVLFEVARMHGGCLTKEENARGDKLYRPEVDETDTNHVLSERRQRERINKRFLVLRSLVPSSGKFDKVSVLDGTIEYLKELKRRLNKLESCKKITELEARTRRKPCDVSERTCYNYGKEKEGNNKRKAFDIEEMRTERNQRTLTNSSTNDVNVSKIERNVLIKMRCFWRENLLLEIIDEMSNLRLDSQSVQSSNINGILYLTINAKLKGSMMVSTKKIRQSLERLIDVQRL